MSAIITTKQLLDTIDALERRMEANEKKIQGIKQILDTYKTEKELKEKLKQIINKL